MKRYTQSITDMSGILPGDCWRTCVASLLDTPTLEEVPHFAMLDDWWPATIEYGRRRGFETRVVGGGKADIELAIASGPSPRGDWLHAVIIDPRNGELAWDPHPSRAGLAGRIVDLVWFVPEK